MRLALKTPGIYIWLSLLICIGYFIAFIFPNHVASENIKMVAVFEPDEAVPLPYVFNMIQPAATIKQALINFAFYEYYFYGYPYFAESALSLLPVVLLQRLGDIPLVMVVLRQVISVLPMLMAILLLVGIQTGFKSYKSIVLLLLLLSIPAVVQNNFWWHPDSLAILFAILAIFFLNRDKLAFGRDFYLAAAMCGFSAATKGIGFYFFVSIFVYLLLGYFSRRAPLWKIFLFGLGFLACMGAAYLLANPILVYRGVRNDFFSVMREQSVLLTSGYGVKYAKGFLVALPVLKEYYGSILFIIVSLLACVLGIVQCKDRLLNIIIITWLLPISIMVFEVTHFKFQYWLPVALPLFSTTINFLPEKIYFSRNVLDFSLNKLKLIFPQLFISLVVVAQLVAFGNSDIQRFLDRLNREEDSVSIQFYDLALKTLEPLNDKNVSVYHDVRLYIPSTPHWKAASAFQLLDYDYIRSRDFDVLLLMQQRINDYLNPEAQGIDAQKFSQSQIFYFDANAGAIAGYHLVFRDEFGLIYVRDQLYQEYFEKK